MWSVKTSAWSVSGLREIHRFERALRHAAKQNILFSLFSKNFLIIPYPYGKRKGNYGLSCRSSRIFTFLSLPFPTFFLRIPVASVVSGAFQGWRGWKYKVFRKNTTQRCGDFFENRRLDLLFLKPAAIPLHLHDNG